MIYTLKFYKHRAVLVGKIKLQVKHHFFLVLTFFTCFQTSFHKCPPAPSLFLSSFHPRWAPLQVAAVGSKFTLMLNDFALQQLRFNLARLMVLPHLSPVWVCYVERYEKQPQATSQPGSQGRRGGWVWQSVSVGWREGSRARCRGACRKMRRDQRGVKSPRVNFQRLKNNCWSWCEEQLALLSPTFCWYLCCLKSLQSIQFKTLQVLQNWNAPDRGLE